MSFAHVKECEKAQISGRRRAFEIEAGGSGAKELLGLAISGGGIRSATFSLGVIQRLAEGGMLKQLDYLSTVSGGGYIGSWLFSWIRCKEAGFLGSKLHAFESVEEALGTEKEHESEEIAFLREYSNYLTPRMSVFNADTWVVGAIWGRNTLLNLAILVAGFAAAVCIVRAIGLAEVFAGKNLDWTGELSWPLALSVLLLLPMVWRIGNNLWLNSKIALDSKPPANRDGESSNGEVLAWCVFPLLSAITYSLWLGNARDLFVMRSLGEGIRANVVVLLPAFLFLELCALLYRCHLEKQRTIHGHVRTSDHFWAVLTYVYAPASAAFVTAALLRAVALLLDTRTGHPDKPWFVFTFGPPLVLVAFTLGIVVHIGLMGRDLPEASREWLGRLRGWLTILTGGWIAATAICIYGPWLVAWIGVKSQVAIATLGSGWILSTAAGLLAGKSDKTSGKAKDGANKGWSKKLLETVALVAPWVFLLGFTVMVAFGVHAVLVHELNVQPEPASSGHAEKQVEKYDLGVKDNKIQLSRQQPKWEESGAKWLLLRYWSHLTCTEAVVNQRYSASGACAKANSSERWTLSGLAPLLGVLVAVGGLLAWRVDINVFSMFYFYKNRLVRCYLGASRQGRRKPSPFTGFDDFDDTPLWRFTTEENYVGPYPLVNATLNVTSGGKLKYQERKAQSFTFTPLYTGFNAETTVAKMRLSDSKTPAESQAPDERGTTTQEPADAGQALGYRPTKKAGGGASVGMAMAISGAAANPNMGYHTSAAVSFLLTVFNVRLGWWFGNTLKETFNSPGPNFGLRCSFQELFGLANADGNYVSLSDGGHFENMGIYELVQRRCRYIICCDGEQDEKLTFGGIGNAIRKCRTDFGVDIDLPTAPLRKEDGSSGAHCVVGRIRYPALDSTEADSTGAMEGYILYLKSSLTGDEPTDVLEYQARQPAFPQQTTGDQWFDESQFESYRKLGYHIADKALSGVLPLANDVAARQPFFEDLCQIWYPRSAAVERNSPAHTDMYGRILDAVRRDTDLGKDFDRNLFQAFSSNGADKGWNHNSGHLCNSFIQLMERVFYDLGLEDRDTWRHPYVEGWLEIFRYWVQTEPFRNTWAVTKESYPSRFCSFYDSLAGAKSAGA